MDYVDSFGRPLFGLVVRCAIAKDGKILLIREKMENTWETPGGGVETGESMEQALRREALEQTGYEIGIVRPLSVSVGEARGVKGLKKVCAVFEAKIIGKAGKPEEKTTVMKWFGREELKKLTPDWHDREAFELFLAGKLVG